MKKALVLAMVFSGLSSMAVAHEAEFEYSNEEYCILKYKLGASSLEVSGYERKLKAHKVAIPSKKTCSYFIGMMREALPEGKAKSWDYRNRKPYPGSAVKLTPAAIERIKAITNEDKQGG